MSSKTERTTRRGFLARSAKLAAGTAALGGLSLARSAHAAGSETIRVAGCAEAIQPELLEKHFLRKHGADAYYGPKG